MLDMDVIYREYADSVFRFLMTLCREECTAEELTQETFYRAVRSAHKYDGTCKVSTWLCQIAKHLWYQELDKRKRKGTSMLEESMVSDKAGPEDELCIREEKMDVFKKVHILDETAKEVVLLRITGMFRRPPRGTLSENNKPWAHAT